MATRIYFVSVAGKENLVRASHPAQALTHVMRAEGSVRLASQEELINLVKKGIDVVDAGSKQTEMDL